MKTLRSLAPLVAVVLGLIGAARAAESLAQIHTPLGELVVVLYDTDKPITVANFKQYIASGRFRDSFVQRWAERFVIQGGGFYVTNRWGASPEITSIATFGTITNEYAVGRRVSNTFGTLAMARVGGQTNSATSQWFFNLTNNVFLDAVDGGFTVFGHVAVGTNVLNRFHAFSLTNGIYWSNLGGPLATLPVLSLTPSYGDLVYTDFSLPAWPQVQLALESDGGRRISWTSLSNCVHCLEFAAGFPPAWLTLMRTNGTGQSMEVRDARLGVAGGFYRIRIESP